MYIKVTRDNFEHRSAYETYYVVFWCIPTLPFFEDHTYW